MVMYRAKPKGKLEPREVNNHKNCIAPGCLSVPENRTCYLTCVSMAFWEEGAQNSKPELQGEESKRRPFM